MDSLTFLILQLAILLLGVAAGRLLRKWRDKKRVKR